MLRESFYGMKSFGLREHSGKRFSRKYMKGRAHEIGISKEINRGRNVCTEHMKRFALSLAVSPLFHQPTLANNNAGKIVESTENISSGERRKKLAPVVTSFSLLSFLAKGCCVFAGSHQIIKKRVEL